MTAMKPHAVPFEVPSGFGNSEKQRRQYIVPTLERLGTIRELTMGLGMAGQKDSEHPPGQNKSIV
jgi:hypothetical protein